MLAFSLPRRQRRFQSSAGGPPEVRLPTLLWELFLTKETENDSLWIQKKKKERKKDMLFVSQVHKLAYFLTCNGKMFVEVRSTHFAWRCGSTSWKSKWCHFFPTCTEVWMNYLLQWPGGNVPCSAQKGAIDLEKCNRNVPVSLTNSWLQNNCLQSLEHPSRSSCLSCFPGFS